MGTRRRSPRRSTPPAAPSRARRGSLIVVGTGISLIAHATTEAVAAMRGAGALFFSVAEPATAQWLRRLNPTATDLNDCYREDWPRWRTYREMTRRVMRAVRGGADVCVAFYGHPGVCADTPHQVIESARREGYRARMLPAVSALDCLFADLGLDPADYGCQCFDATDFLASRRVFDPTSLLVLWQVGVLGEPGFRGGMICRPERLQVLASALRRRYPARHPVVLYDAAEFPLCEPRITTLPLARLPGQTVRPVTTLLVPPKAPRPDDAGIVRWLERE
jgi:uncharacterized protein YabN with tetrapyrrole methylase and pyrophosphatase domain